MSRLVADFSRIYKGQRDSQGRLLPGLALPTQYAFGDSRFTQDVRLSWTFALRENWRATVVADLFNVLNVANLEGYTGDLADPGFGQPRTRVAQAFGSGGPRALQLAFRLRY